MTLFYPLHRQIQWVFAHEGGLAGSWRSRQDRHLPSPVALEDVVEGWEPGPLNSSRLQTNTKLWEDCKIALRSHTGTLQPNYVYVLQMWQNIPSQCPADVTKQHTFSMFWRCDKTYLLNVLQMWQNFIPEVREMSNGFVSDWYRWFQDCSEISAFSVGLERGGVVFCGSITT